MSNVSLGHKVGGGGVCSIRSLHQSKVCWMYPIGAKNAQLVDGEIFHSLARDMVTGATTMAMTEMGTELLKKKRLVWQLYYRCQ